jgi:hypothetical protein
LNPRKKNMVAVVPKPRMIPSKAVSVII